jgi:hypothetical protein
MAATFPHVYDEMELTGGAEGTGDGDSWMELEVVIPDEDGYNIDTPVGEKLDYGCPEAPTKLPRTEQLNEITGLNLLAQFMGVECGDTDIPLPRPLPVTEGRYIHEGYCCGTRQCKSGCWKYWCGTCGRGTNLMFSGCRHCRK